jgi:TRAP-type mannitol/chloroaromatic compound transport system substrate-binding protein
MTTPFTDDLPSTDERTDWSRRGFIGAAGALAGAALLAACSGDDDDQVSSDGSAAPGGTTGGTTGATTGGTATDTVSVVQDSDLPEIEWEMPTSWPLALDTIYGGAEIFAETLNALTGGRFNVIPKPAGEVAPPLEVLNVVEQGAYNIGHTASYYYIGKHPATAFGTALPFGLNSRQQNAWLYERGGLELMQALYAEKFGVIQFPAGNTGVQMGGWYKSPIESVSDLQGLKMRIPGLGGQVMAKLGVNVQVIAGGEILQSLQTGAIDAAEWVGPYDDEKLGFMDAVQVYHYPGWWEPGPSLEVQINKAAYDELPDFYKACVQAAAKSANIGMMARYDALNPAALARLVAAGAQVLPFPDDVMEAAKTAAEELMDENAAADADFAEILEHWRAFRAEVQPWHKIAELAVLNHGLDLPTG